MGIPASGRLAFLAWRGSSQLGEHRLTFSTRDGVLTVEIAVDYAVKLGFITVFRYALRGRETWSDGVLQAAQATTDNNGKKEFMRAMRDGASLMVEGTAARRYTAPEGSLIASHWNRAQLDAPMINPQDGTLLRFAVTPGATMKVRDSAGGIRMARHYSLAGADPLELWYDADDIWTSLRAKVRDGSTIVYRPVA